jgi:hypothetical protein
VRQFIREIDGHDLLIAAGFLCLNAGLVLLWSVGIALLVSGALMLGAAGWQMR